MKKILIVLILCCLSMSAFAGTGEVTKNVLTDLLYFTMGALSDPYSPVGLSNGMQAVADRHARKNAEQQAQQQPQYYTFNPKAGYTDKYHEITHKSWIDLSTLECNNYGVCGFWIKTLNYKNKEGEYIISNIGNKHVNYDLDKIIIDCPNKKFYMVNIVFYDNYGQFIASDNSQTSHELIPGSNGEALYNFICLSN